MDRSSTAGFLFGVGSSELIPSRMQLNCGFFAGGGQEISHCTVYGTPPGHAWQFPWALLGGCCALSLSYSLGLLRHIATCWDCYRVLSPPCSSSFLPDRAWRCWSLFACSSWSITSEFSFFLGYTHCGRFPVYAHRHGADGGH